jgi:hypothetical protein
MQDARPIVEPIPPGTRVAVFLNEAASGAVLGYYGTLLGVSPVTMRFNANIPERWQYRIQVPALRETILCKSDTFLVTRNLDGHTELVSAMEVARFEIMDTPWELQFACPVHNDNHELYGVYRFGASGRGLFHFRKCDRVQPSYKFRLGSRPYGRNLGRLTFQVPAHEVLSRNYVLREMTAVLGCFDAGKGVCESYCPGDDCEIVS